MGQIWGAMRDETISWLTRLCMDLETPHATVADGHRNLVLTMAMDLSAARGKALKLPIDLEEFYASACVELVASYAKCCIKIFEDIQED
jgi:hypothetical protein